ncbi:MAG: DNA recombination/repair protein RecA, partial [Pedosphaera sp.]|nr:DNA recombination/repair protein RecA [Pedosphaera sp.]
MAKPKATEQSAEDAARHQSLDNALSLITKTFGEGSIMRLGDAQALSR